MARKRFSEVLVDAFGGRKEMPISELRSVIFRHYSRLELARRGSMEKRNKAQKKYAAGEQITDEERERLVARGINYIVRTVGCKRFKGAELDRSRGVVIYVEKIRKKLGS